MYICIYIYIYIYMYIYICSWARHTATRSAAMPPASAYSWSPMSRSSDRAARQCGKKAAASSRIERRRSLLNL